MDPRTIITFQRAANEARRVIGKPPVADYCVERIPDSAIQRAFETALYQDARAADLIEKRDLALAEARRQVASTTK